MGVAPIGSELRHHLPQRWVRFHFLPGGERVAATVPQKTEALSRYLAVLTALCEAAPADPLLVVTCGWGSAAPAARHPDLVDLLPAEAWQSVPAASSGDLLTTVYASALQLGRDDDVLRELLLTWVADDRTADVILAPASLAWLFHPYDGGMDVIAPDPATRDRLSDRFREWLSPLPSGL